MSGKRFLGEQQDLTALFSGNNESGILKKFKLWWATTSKRWLEFTGEDGTRRRMSVVNAVI
jgi:hypothetical protein